MRPLESAEARAASRPIFEKIYEDYNRRIYVSPDPLQFLYDYESAADREVVGLIASALAYGRVAQILRSVRRVLEALGEHPAEYLKRSGRGEYDERLAGFVHRFTDGASICCFLGAIGEALREYGSLEKLFISGWRGDIYGAMENFAGAMNAYAGCENSFLLPRPSKGSACKRMALYLRWMVRHDDVDPGGWREISPADLIVPLDTHLFNIASTLGLCSLKSANGRAAAEITENFRELCAEDPVKYDFSLTRYGIREEMTVEELFAKWHCGRGR